MIITEEKIREWEELEPSYRRRYLPSGWSGTAADLLADETVSAQKKLFILLRPELFSEDILFAFLRNLALQVAKMWPAPQSMLDFLQSGDPELAGSASIESECRGKQSSRGDRNAYFAALSALKPLKIGPFRPLSMKEAARLVSLYVVEVKPNPVDYDAQLAVLKQIIEQTERI